jgi:hypothetical protein
MQIEKKGRLWSNRDTKKKKGRLWSNRKAETAERTLGVKLRYRKKQKGRLWSYRDKRKWRKDACGQTEIQKMQKERLWKKCRKVKQEMQKLRKSPPLEKAEEHHIGLWMQESTKDFFVWEKCLKI